MNVRFAPSAALVLVTSSEAEPLAPIVPVPVASLMLIAGGKFPDGSDRVTVKVSSPSTSMSSVKATVNVWVSAGPVDPAAKVKVPLVDVKSDCMAVSPVAMLVA